AEQELDGGGLARAVGAEQAEDLAAMDLQVERAECGLLLPPPEIAVHLRQLAGLDDDFVGHAGATSFGAASRGRGGGASPPAPHYAGRPGSVRRFLGERVLGRRQALSYPPFATFATARGRIGLRMVAPSCLIKKSPIEARGAGRT